MTLDPLDRGPAASRDPLPANGSATAQGSATEQDLAAVRAQLGRPARSVMAVAHRCPCGLPDVVATAPRLDDGTPFPTTFYLTCPRAASAVGTCESTGTMREMSERLGQDDGLAAGYRAAHQDYLARREAFAAAAGVGPVPEIAGVSAGGMPDRVKCLHVLLAHSLAAGPGVNPLGDEVRATLGEWWRSGPCVPPEPASERRPGPEGAA